MEELWRMRSRDDEVSIEWIASNEDLAEAVGGWGSVLTIDTEFVRTNTYYPMPGLYQIGDGQSVYLLDPLEITEWKPFVDVLEDASVVKIMHACQEDSELIFFHLGVNSKNVFDTQFAQAFVSEDYSLSYARLVERRLGVALDKHETRSDWRARPLTDKQIDYAVEDVIYLEAIYRALCEELQAANKQTWFELEMQARADYQPVNPDLYYRGVKKAWQLSGVELGRLQHLCAWREITARKENVPRNRVVWDQHLFQFAQIEQLSDGDVREALPHAIARRYGERLRSLFDKTPVQTLEPIPTPLNSKQGAVVKLLRESGLVVSKAQQIAPELICRKKDLEACVRHFGETAQLSDQYDNWRSALVGDKFLSILQSAQS
ncbi:MAG: ribonuclease D [Limisphaerales bacterium]|jgi:ribonuclease D